MEFLKSQCVEDRPWLFSREVKTTMSQVEQIEQVIRSYLYTWFNKDVPYKIEQKTVGWTPRLDGSLVIEQELVVADSVVARMILGVRNRMLYQLKMHVQNRLELLWGIKPIVVHLWVKAEKQRVSRQDQQASLKAKFETNLYSKGSGGDRK